MYIELHVFRQRVNFIFGMYVTFLCHLIVNPPKDNPVCLSLGRTIQLCTTGGWTFIIFILTVWYTSGLGRKTGIQMSFYSLRTALSLFSLVKCTCMYSFIYCRKEHTTCISICHDFILQQDSTLHVYWYILNVNN